MTTFITTIPATDPPRTDPATEPYTQEVDDAVCQVNFHATEHLDARGYCSDRKLGYVQLNASVGFAAVERICTEYDTEFSGAPTTLYMTIQPKCRRQGERQRWSVLRLFLPRSFHSDTALFLSQ